MRPDFAIVLGAVVLALGGSVGQPRAQSPASSLPSTPSGCLKATREFHAAKMKEAGLPMTAEKYRAVQKQKIEFAAACVAGLAVDSVKGEELTALADVYLEAGQPDLAVRAVERAVADAGSDPAAQAPVLLAAARITMRQPLSEARNTKAESYVRRLESLPASFARQKIEGHAILNAYYRGDDIDRGIIEHSRRILQLNTSLTPEERRPLARTLVAACANLAEALAGQEQTDEAIKRCGGRRWRWRGSTTRRPS